MLEINGGAPLSVLRKVDARDLWLPLRQGGIDVLILPQGLSLGCVAAHGSRAGE